MAAVCLNVEFLRGRANKLLYILLIMLYILLIVNVLATARVFENSERHFE
jgi:hypothetical protein